jgi:calcium/calmodulin-dependent protein kinase (CaM kinase) II
MSAPTDEILALTRRLLDAVAAGDWQTYRGLVADDLTCFEPEAHGQLVEGLAFHEFYFRLPRDPARPPQPAMTTLASPVVRMLGTDVALVAYVRLVQKLDDAGKPVTVGSEETRLWQKLGGRWQHVHFHRSLPG